MMNLKLKIVILFFFISGISLTAQTDWQRWEAKEISYELPTFSKRDYSVDNSSVGMTMLSISRDAYYFFISDLDGDNCPFYPTCSRFFIESVKETNIFKGTLMFADRFTRDMNPVKNFEHYSFHKSGKFFDPSYNYTLNFDKIKLLSECF